MHILLTDLLTCPRCGPDFGLIVLSDRLAERRVLEGSLGCANCRSIYPIHGGIADLRVPDGAELSDASIEEGDPDRPVRLAALLGVTSPNAAVLVLERSGAAATGMAPLIPEVHVIGGSGDEPGIGDDVPLGVLSRVKLGEALPFRSASMSGLAAVGIDVGNLLGEALRILRPDGRIVVEGGVEDLPELLRREGFQVHLEQDGVVVASPVGRS